MRFGVSTKPYDAGLDQGSGSGIVKELLLQVNNTLTLYDDEAIVDISDIKESLYVSMGLWSGWTYYNNDYIMANQIWLEK
jgi:hypothetical protein